MGACVFDALIVNRRRETKAADDAELAMYARGEPDLSGSELVNVKTL